MVSIGEKTWPRSGLGAQLVLPRPLLGHPTFWPKKGAFGHEVGHEVDDAISLLGQLPLNIQFLMNWPLWVFHSRYNYVVE